MARTVARKRHERRPIELVDFTPREIDVLDLIVEGHPNKIIADRLKISDHTAKFHVANALWKIGTNNKTHAAALWVMFRASQRRAVSSEGTQCDRCSRCEQIVDFIQKLGLV